MAWLVESMVSAYSSSARMASTCLFVFLTYQYFLMGRFSCAGAAPGADHTLSWLPCICCWPPCAGSSTHDSATASFKAQLEIHVVALFLVLHRISQRLAMNRADFSSTSVDADSRYNAIAPPFHNHHHNHHSGRLLTATKDKSRFTRQLTYVS